MQKCFQSLGFQPEDLPETLKASREVLSLPIFPELEEEEIRIVVDSVKQFFAMSQRQGLLNSNPGISHLQQFSLKVESAFLMTSD